RMAAALAVGLLLPLPACDTHRVRSPSSGEPASQRKDALHEAEPRWQDALVTRPELLISLRPRAMREDRIYGPLLRQVLGLARQRSRIVAGTRLLEAMEEADELVANIETDGAPTPAVDADPAG